jgi:hypothetical protein
MYTNIENLPEGNYFTEIGYTQTYPWQEVRRTPKTVVLRPVTVSPSDSWKPIFHPGGFVGNCENQDEQVWKFFEFGDFEITIRLTKKGAWVRKGKTFIENSARHFYDYNF